MSIEDDIAFLGRINTFALLGPAALRILAIGAETREFAPGELLFTAGEAADCGYVVQEGSFTLKPRDAGNPPRQVTVGRGALLGEIALLVETVRPATATAAEAATVMRISRSLFRKMLEGFPDAAERLREHIATRTSQATDDMLQVRAALDPPARAG
jgi:CRP-like cAMP-binding protein